ncbi:MAG: ABC transporter permease [Bacillales bacterium]|nr:ABC transporter permease [Bacillales bacterium]
MVKHPKLAKILAQSYVWLILLLMYLPIIVLVIFSFTATDEVGVWGGFSLELYGRLFQNKDLMTAVGNTVLIAVVSAIISTILGTLGAVGVFYSGKKYNKTVETMTQLPVVNAEIVMALSLAVLFKTLNTSYTFFTLVVGHVVLTVAFVYLNVKPKLVQMDSSTYEAALDLGATPWYALFKIILPEIIPGILSGFLISITLSLDDFVITQYLKEPSFETISTYIQKIVTKHPIPAEVRALTTFIFLIVLATVIGITIYNNKKASSQAKSRRK